MEGNIWRPAAPPDDLSAVGPSGDWRKQLLPEERQRIVNKIMDTLKRHLPISVPEGLNELKKTAVRFEEKIYTAATTQSDYLRKISLKMLSMETKTQGAAAINPSLSNPTIGNQSPSDSASMDSTTQTGHDWQEEIYQKVKSMKELYYAEISELHQKISLKIQQLPQSEVLGPPAKQSAQFEKLKQFKLMLERTMMFLQLSKNSIQPNMKDRLPMYEKQIMSFLSSNRNKNVAPSQQQGQPHFPHPSGHSMPQQQPSQVPQLQPHDNLLNQSQQMNLQATQQNMANALQPQTMDPMQGSSFSSLQQGAMGSMQQGGLGSLQNTSSAPQQSSNAPQPHQLQQQQQEQQNQLKQLQQRQMQQLYQQQQKQQMLQQAPMQQQLHQQKQQQTSQG